jgi:hypothetical protein
MQSQELNGLIAEMKETNMERFIAVAADLMKVGKMTGWTHGFLYPIPNLSEQLATEKDRTLLAGMISDVSRLTNSVLALCCFFASSGRTIDISYTQITSSSMGETERVSISCHGKLTEEEIAESELFMAEELHLQFGRRGNGGSCCDKAGRTFSSSQHYTNAPLKKTRSKRKNVSTTLSSSV